MSRRDANYELCKHEVARLRAEVQTLEALVKRLEARISELENHSSTRNAT